MANRQQGSGEPHEVNEPKGPLADYRDRQRLAEMLSRLRKAVDEHGRCNANYKRVIAEGPLGEAYQSEECQARTDVSHAEANLIRAAYAVFGLAT